MTAMEIEPAADSGRNRGSGCSGQETATQMMFKILCGLSNILNITKENRSRKEAAVAEVGAGDSGLRPWRQW